MVVVLIGAIITFKYVKETKNKTYDEIAQMYYGKDENDPDDPAHPVRFNGESVSSQLTTDTCVYFCVYLRKYLS
jgi:hypothetical protein